MELMHVSRPFRLSRTCPRALFRTHGRVSCVRGVEVHDRAAGSQLLCARCRHGSDTRWQAGYHTSTGRSSAWAAAVSVAANVASNAVKRVGLRADEAASPSADPLRFMAGEMKFLADNMRSLLRTGHPSLSKVAKYYTKSGGKHFRPLIVLLMARATSQCPKASTGPSDRSGIAPMSPANRSDGQSSLSSCVDSSISPLAILADFDPLALLGKDQDPERESSATTATQQNRGLGPEPESLSWQDRDILPSQRRLAEIAELIHTASLLHDDVIDHSVSRRGSPSANLAFGNKMAVLAGDFLLGRASVALARLRNAEVVELLSTVIANLVEGEFMQLKNTDRGDRNPIWSEEVLGYYLRKTYLKTASLISKSCRAAALLGGTDGATVEAAYAYGKSIGLAFQLVDDMLDYTRTHADLGKPAGADLELGLATAPLLFAWRSVPELGGLVGRRFEGDGDVERARQLVMESDGIEQTRALAEDYAKQAVEAIQSFPESEAKAGLIEMANKTVKRQK